MRPVRRARRRAFASTLAILGFGVIVAFAVLLARYATIDIAGARRAELESYAHQIIRSAQAWSGLHAGEFAETPVVELSFNDILPGNGDGKVELSCTESSGGEALIECHVVLRLGQQTLRRRVCWPRPSAATTRPAADPATP